MCEHFHYPPEVFNLLVDTIPLLCRSNSDRKTFSDYTLSSIIILNKIVKAYNYEMEKTLKRIRNPEMLSKLGRLLRAERERKGLTQAQASRRVRGLRQATISKIERGGDATLDTLVSYATALGIELTWVPVGRSSESANAALSSSGPTGAARSTLLEELADLKDDES